jgi:flagella basal body P-ring formation protein FlgA
MVRLLIPRALLPALLTALGAAAPTTMRAQERRFPLTAATVAAALQKAGLPVAAAQIDLPGSLSATAEHPELRITNAELLADGRLRVRLACRPQGQCLAFLATVHLSGAESGLAGVAALNATVQDAAPVHAERGPGLQAGRQTTLLMRDGKMLIELPVIAIDSGVTGEEVRVSSLDRKQTFRGVVTREQTVEADLR